VPTCRELAARQGSAGLVHAVPRVGQQAQRRRLVPLDRHVLPSPLEHVFRCAAEPWEGPHRLSGGQGRHHEDVAPARDHRHGARRHELTSWCRGLPPWLYLSGLLEVPLKVHVRVGICPMLKGQCLHALYVREVRNENHEIPEKGSNSDKSRKGVERRKSQKWF
jgi:hypothetical protein